MNSGKIGGIPKLKDTMLLVGWISALLIIAGSCWIITQPARSRFLIRAVNRALEQSGDIRRLVERSNSGTTGSLIMGSWFTISLARQASVNAAGNFEEGTKAFVFSFIGDGTFFPCAALVSAGGKVQEFIPLNRHGERVLRQISPGIIRLYTRRIEGAQS